MRACLAACILVTMAMQASAALLQLASPLSQARVGGSQQQRQSRRLSAVPAVTLGGPQTCFQPGASVYDASQHGQRRGYGIIDRRAADADDGTRKWYVQWDSAAPGSRCTAISETYLRLSHIHHSSRVSPTGLQQPIVVMVGTYKGKAGVTEQKLGGKWTCKLDGVEERQPFKSEQLHATAPPPSDTTLTAFQPKVVDAKLPVGDIAAFISNLQLDPDQPVELRRLHPESGTMLDLMTRTLLPSELDDDMLRRLRYKAAGPPVEPAQLRMAAVEVWWVAATGAALQDFGIVQHPC